MNAITKCLIAGVLVFTNTFASAQQSVTWTNVMFLNISGNYLEKVGNVQTAWNAGAISQQNVYGDGWVEFRFVNARYSVVGLSHHNTSVDPSSIDYGLFIHINANVYVYEKGVRLAVSVFIRNSANNGFTHAGNYAVGTSVTNIMSGDFNGDGKMDIVTTNWYSNNATVLIRNSANTGFNSAVHYNVGTNPRGLTIGDFNGDGRTDLAIGNHGSFSVGVLLRNSANNGFNPVVTYPVGIYAQWVVVGDFNGDGKSDLAVNGFQQNNPTDNNIYILVNNGNGTFQSPLGLFVNGFIRSMTTGDYNGDGMADLAPAHNGASDVFILESNLAMWKGISNDWTEPQNWWGGKTPTANSETVVTDCTACPQLSTTKQVRRLWVENSILVMNGNTVEINEDVFVRHVKLQGGGMLQATDFLEFTNNTADEKLVLKKTGGIDNLWTGGNRYNTEFQIINTSTKTISTATQAPDLLKN